MKLYQDVIFQDFNNKVVKCTLTGKLSYTDPFTNVLKEEEFTTIGYAKCHNDDSFNLEVGKRIAESKASIKFYKKVRSYYKSELRKMMDIGNIFMESFKKVEKLLQSENEHLIMFKK